jgi:VWFA-related protein
MRRFGIIGLVFVAALTGQKKQKMPDLPHSPRLVTLNVSAVDASGSRPGDLTEDDFQISDNGKPQKIASFRINNSKPQPAKVLAPHEFSNRAGAAIPHATLILFDLLNDRMGAKGYAWNEIIRTLGSLETNENVYLYLLSSDARFYPVHALPDEEGANQPDNGDWTRDIKAKLDDAMNKASRVRPIDMNDPYVRVRTTYHSLETIASRLSAVPGRKNLVWITRGIPIDLGPERSGTGGVVDFSSEIQWLSTALDRVNIAVYPVDIGPAGMDPSADASTGRAGIPPVAGLGSMETLQQFADLTGGQAFLNNDVKAAITQATADARMSYVLSYYPNPQAFDGKYHKIRVTCSQKGVKVHSKAGYYAYPTQAVSRTQHEATLDAALASQFDAAQIGIDAKMTPSKKFYTSIHLDIGIDPGSAADSEGGQFLITLEDMHGDGKNGVSPTVSLDYPAGYKPGSPPIPFEQERTFDGAPPKVRIVVMDAKSNAVGSLTIPVTPADLSPGPAK